MLDLYAIERSKKLKNRKNILLSLNTLLLSTIGTYLVNNIIHLKAVSKERLYNDNCRYYDWKFGKVFYSVHGTGSPMLLIHDLSCEGSSYEWKKTISSLSKYHQVYVIDLIGCGKSDKPNIIYTNYLYVQLINDFIKNIIKHRTHIVATGLSSTAVIMACYIEPDLFHKLTLVNPPSLNDLNKSRKKINYLIKKVLEIPIWGTLLYNVYQSKILIRKRLKNKYLFDSKHFNSHTVEAFSEASHLGGYSSKFLLSSIKSNYLNANITHALSTIKQDTQIIIGSSNCNKRDIKHYYYECNPKIEFTIIKNTNHLPQLEHPQTFTKTICK